MDNRSYVTATFVLFVAPDEVPDICGFLDGKKKVCDNDPETNPFDDVRHYAYEGDGNTTGSLSSLASGELRAPSAGHVSVHCIDMSDCVCVCCNVCTLNCG
jgi:hypothetical protein